jgi:hypothetical protein
MRADVTGRRELCAAFGMGQVAGQEVDGAPNCLVSELLLSSRMRVRAQCCVNSHAPGRYVCSAASRTMRILANTPI